MQLTAATASLASAALFAANYPDASPGSPPLYAADPPGDPHSNPHNAPQSPTHLQQPAQAASPQLRRSPRRLNPGLAGAGMGDDPPSPNVTYTRGSRRRGSMRGRAAPSPLGPKPAAAAGEASSGRAEPGSRLGQDITAGVPALSTLLEESEADLMSRSKSSTAKMSRRDTTISSMPSQPPAEPTPLPTALQAFPAGPSDTLSVGGYPADPTDVSMELTLGAGLRTSQPAAISSAPDRHPAGLSQHQSGPDHKDFEPNEGTYLHQQQQQQQEEEGIDTRHHSNAGFYSVPSTSHDSGPNAHMDDVSMDLTFGAPTAWMHSHSQRGRKMLSGHASTSCLADQNVEDQGMRSAGQRSDEVTADVSMDLTMASGASLPVLHGMNPTEGLMTVGLTGELALHLHQQPSFTCNLFGQVICACGSCPMSILQAGCVAVSKFQGHQRSAWHS